MKKRELTQRREGELAVAALDLAMKHHAADTILHEALLRAIYAQGLLAGLVLIEGRNAKRCPGIADLHHHAFVAVEKIRRKAKGAKA